ncbi:MAG: AAA family ATPase [Halieaceae bacterium]|nr:AAA family ATPase [Halieaceae bacterium]
MPDCLGIMARMYHRYFGMQEAPFSIAVNPRYLYMSDRHRDALAHLLYGVGSGGGFVLLTGEVGTGKTTLIRCLLEQLPEQTDLAIVLNPALNSQELLATVCDELGIQYGNGDYTLKTLTDRLHAFLLENHQRGRQTVLLIDEAQHLRFEVLEQIRLLTNLETNTRKLLQIILVGQPELAEILARPELRQLNQRVSARFELHALNQRETRAYIGHRLQVAGLPAGQELFPGRVVKAVYRRSGGIPRLINLLCDRMLLGCYGRNQLRVDMAMYRAATAEVLGAGESRPWAGIRPWLLAVLLLAAGLGGFGAWQDRPMFASPTPVLTPAAPAQSPTTPAPELSPSPPAPAISPPGPPAPVQVTPGPLDIYWEADFGAALGQLAKLAGVVGAGPDPACDTLPQQGWACLSRRVQTWNELLEYGRPALLTLVTEQRYQAFGILLSLSVDQAGLWVENRVVEVPIAELASRWQGEFTLIWQAPAGFSRPLRVGDSDPVVAWLAQQFAELDGQSQPLATELFNPALATRVKYFQRESGLSDDGVAGVKTLLKLQQALGQARSLSTTGNG